MGVNDGRPVVFRAADGGTVHGIWFGEGTYGVILAHGMLFNKESWFPLARKLAARGFVVLSFDFRGYGQSVGADGGLADDVLGAFRYLKGQGIARIALLGGSMGARAALEALPRIPRGELDAVIALSPTGGSDPRQYHGSLLFIATQGEALVGDLQRDLAQAPEPKRLLILPGSAHAQNIFATPQGPELERAVLEFLEARRASPQG